MTILPTTKGKKLRKDEKRGDEWRGEGSGGQSCSSHSHRLGISPPVISHSSHSSLPHSHPSPLSPGPPRKVARVWKAGVSSSLSSLSLPPSLPPTQVLISPRESREETVSSANGEHEGPNSDDEYDRGFRDEEMERNFESRLKDERGLDIKKMVGDGACLFRGVSHQIYGDEGMHGEVRRLCLDYMEKNREHFEQFITEDFEAYITRKRRPTVHGNHVELQAISEIYNRPIEIYEYNINPINVFHPKSSGASSSSSSSSFSAGNSGSNEKKEKEDEINAPIRLSYHGSTHYNAVIDPRVATVGVGLGLPSFEPGLADRQLIADAISKSEMHQIEQAMLNDKMSMTDWERTEEDLKDQVLRASYMEYARSVEGSEASSSRRGESSSSSIPHPPPASPQPCSSRDMDTPERSAPVQSSSSGRDRPKQSSLYEELLMAEALEWNEDSNYESSLAEALVLSQQTFLTEYRRRPDGQGGSKD
ncbi:hypothetical protein PMAYCL1PPCAC_18218 [Pristionchus mayeri]|uniref:ubiquitinyl hydrolase 1 n=1 Tax=Pristionchus mayeri TaxID=1317129 RepID=A0AAN5CP64_9BILA|nr:hypothetical protein PMAYCL1PPCAC_18218 [Pristionchus mayeri]